MKKFHLLLAAGIASFTAQAQITITRTDMPAGGETYQYSTVQAGSTVDVTGTGANHTWNFQGLVSTGDVEMEYKKSNNTPYSFYFLSSFGLKTADSLGFGQFSLKDMYSFYKTTAANFTAEGLGFKFSGIPLAGFYTDEDEIYKFPLKFNDNDENTFRVQVSIPALGGYVQAGTRKNAVDGWGTIHTPAGSYSCLRVKSVITEIDSFKVTQPFPINFGFPLNRTEYKWLAFGEKVPVLEILGTEVGGNFVPSTIRYKSTKTSPGVSVPEIEESRIQVYPNPAADKLFVNITRSYDEVVKLFDINGKEIAVTFAPAANGIEINTSAIAAGNYMLFVKAGQELFWEKVEVVK